MPSLHSLARGAPTPEAWRAATDLLDTLGGDALEDAVSAFESASGHWPTRLDPWQGYSSDPGIELRRATPGWVREVYAGEHTPKHKLVRVLDSPRKLKRGQALENVLNPGAQLPNVRQVGFDQARLTSGFLKAWRGDGPWRRWEALRLWTCALSPANVKLVAAADLSAMTMLNLEQNALGEAGVAAMVKAPGFAALRGLHLGHNGLDAGAAQALHPAPWLRSLTRLHLGTNRLSDSAMALLAAQGALGAVTWLDLSRNPLGVDTRPWAPGLERVEHLTLNNAGLTDDGLVGLLERCPALRSLHLDVTSVGDAGALALAQSPHPWRALSLQGTAITPVGLRAVLTSPGAQTLEHLQLGAGLTLDNARLLVEGALPNLKFLWWYGPELGEGAEAVLRNDLRIAATLPY